MGLEIERKYLPRNARTLPLPRTYNLITQGYLARENGNAVRIRTSETAGIMSAVLCIKGAGTPAGTPEFEYTVPLGDAKQLLNLCGTRVLTKRRYHIQTADHFFEVDQFLGQLKGLWVIELELDAPHQQVTLPAWVGTEITGDSRYYNAVLVSSGRPK